MSMTREEAIDIIENKIQIDVRFCTKEEVKQYQEALTMAITALRPVSREQVEKVWKGEWKLIGASKTGRGGIWYCTRCEKCYPYKCDFCPRCGAPMTDEAVQAVMERLEALKDES